MTAADTQPMATPVPRPAPAPRASAGASRIAVGCAIAIVAVGGVALRDAALALGWIRGGPWLPPALRAIAELRPAWWLTPAGAALAVVGVALCVVACAPRRRTARPLTAATAVYVRRADVVTVAAAAARDVPGVLNCRATASRRAVTVRCRITGGQLGDDVRAAVSEQLGRLDPAPRVVVRLRTEQPS